MQTSVQVAYLAGRSRLPHCKVGAPKKRIGKPVNTHAFAKFRVPTSPGVPVCGERGGALQRIA